MDLLKVFHHLLRRRRKFLVLGLLAITAQLMGQSLVGTGSQPFAVAVNPVTNKIYVANRGQNTVTVIDGATNTTRTVIVGIQPVALAVNPVTNKVYVANSGSNFLPGSGSVTVINEAQLSVRTFLVPLNPQAILVNPVTNKIYVAASNGSGIVAINQDGNVTVIDGRTDRPTDTIAVGRNPFALALNPVTNRIYVANAGIGNNCTVSVINGTTDTAFGSQIVVPQTPIALAVNTVTNKIYVIGIANNLGVIDGVSGNLATTTLPATRLSAIAVNPVTNFIYITAQNIVTAGVMVAVNGATDTVSGTPITI